MGKELFTTARTKLLTEYQGRGKAFLANTKPYKSTDTIRGIVVNKVVDAGGLNVAAFLKFVAGTTMEFFTRGLGTVHPVLAQMTDSETNLTTPYRTNGGEDFVVEGMSCGPRGYRVQAFAAPDPAKYTDDQVKLALAGGIVMADPGCLYVPPQVGSPFNLENAIWEALCPYLAIHTEMNHSEVKYTGTLDQVPEGTGKSLLKSHGDPNVSNRFKTPEGIIWRGQNGPDCEFAVKVQLMRNVIIPITAITVPHAGAVADVPNFVDLEVVLRVHGLALKYPSSN